MKRIARGDVHVAAGLVHDNQSNSRHVKEGKSAPRFEFHEHVDIALVSSFVARCRPEQVKRGCSLCLDGRGVLANASNDLVATHGDPLASYSTQRSLIA